MILRELRQIDFKIYIQALAMYFKNPVVALAPLATGLANILLSIGLYTGMIAWLLSIILNLVGLAGAIIVADYVWRARGVSLDQVWNLTQPKIGDILVASIGVLFVVALPSLLAGIFGPIVPLLQGIAFVFVIYAIPAAAIGGTPGGAALQASIDHTRAFPATTVILCVVCYGAFACAPLIAGPLLTIIGSHIDRAVFVAIASIVSAFTRALSFGYIALVLARVYNETSYMRRF
jgi:hypothetical protein